MQTYIIAGCVMLLGFFVPIICYRIGLREGYELAKGKTPEPIKNPVKVVQEVINDNKTKKENSEYLEGLNNLLNYTGDPQGGED